jgi:uncharacterized RDD family membrane protein YckC
MTSVRLAGFATRALGLLLDIVLIDVAILVFAWTLNLLGLDSRSAVFLGLAATGWVVLLSSYLLLFWTLTGQTPGMRFMGIRVTDRRGCPPSLVRSLRRLVGMYLAAIPLGAGFLLILVDDRRRGLHDRIGGTLVIHAAATDQPRTRVMV